MRLVVLLVVLLTLARCAPPPPAVPMPLATPPPAPAASPAEATPWLTDGSARLGREAGAVRGVVVALDAFGHAHVAYQVDSDWLGPLNEGGVIVTGMTPAGDPYERRLATTAKGYDANGIGAAGQRVIVTAGPALRAWESQDGGATWHALAHPLDNAAQADVAFVPDGRAVLIAQVRVSTGWQTQIAVETADGWTVATPFAASTQPHHAVWHRDPDDPAQAALPAVVVVSASDSGAAIARSADGTWWQTTTLASRPAWTPRLVAAGGTLVLAYHTYGAAGLTLATSADGGATWTARTLWADTLTSGLTLEDATPLWDGTALTLLATRHDRVARARRLVLLRAPLAAISDASAWTPDWQTRPWSPFPLPATHTDQARPALAVRAGLAAVVWEADHDPPDRRTALEGDYRAWREGARGVLRLGALEAAWQAEVAHE